MLANITLYKTKITRSDTMYFASKADQDNFFNNFTDRLDIPQCSYNGSRAIRLDGFSWTQLYNKYNYCRIVFNNMTVYGFIDNFEFVNDECSDVVITPDFLQTFMFDISIADTMVESRTVTDTEFKKYIPYSNKMTPQDYDVTVLGDLGTMRNNNYFGFILITVDMSFNPILSVINNVLTDNGSPTHTFTIALPIEYDPVARTFVNRATMQYGPTVGGVTNRICCSGYFLDIMKNIPSESVVGVGVKMNTINSDIIFGQDGANEYIYNLDGITPQTATIPNVTYPVMLLKQSGVNKAITKTIDLTPYLEKEGLNRSPYLNIKVGNYYEAIDLNLLDYYDQTSARADNNLVIKHWTSITYPYMTNVEFIFGGKPINNRDFVFNINEAQDVPYSTSKWADFFANNKQWATIGLQTQQAYDRKSLGVENGFNSFDMALNLVNPMASLQSPKLTKAGNVDKRYTKQNAQINRSNNATVRGGILGTASGLLAQAESYVQLDIQFERERSMQNIEFNDIKTSPNVVNNNSASTGVKSSPYCPTIYISLYKAKNIADITAFHKKYGYRISRVEPVSIPITPRHNTFDYLQLQNFEILTPYATAVKDSINALLQNGVRFWYNHNTMLDFTVPNNEI